MQIDELLELTNWIDKNIKENNIQSKYQALLSILQSNANPRNNQSRQPFANEQKDIIDTIKNINTHHLTYAQDKTLKQIGILDYIGSNGVNLLEDILFRNNLDIANAIAEINKIISNISSGINKSDQLKSSLTPIVDKKPESTEENKHEVMLRIHFQNEVSLNNITDFKKLSNVWWEIGRGIAMAHNMSPEDIKIIGAQKGSIIIELATVAAIATTTSTIILSALKVADRVLSIRKQLEEIKALKLNNKKIEDDLERAANEEKTTGLEKIKDEIVLNLKININGDGEKVKVLERSVKNLVDFIEKGGEVDFVTSSDSVESENGQLNEQLELLKSNFQEIKRIESTLLSLEQKKS